MVPPVIHTIPSDPAIVGTPHNLCLEGISGGVSSANWTLDGTSVVAIDISNLTNPGNSNVTNFVPPLCDMCSCFQKYRSVGGIEAELKRAGIAAFVVSMYSLAGVAMVSERSRLCYGVRNRFLSVLLIESVARSEGGQATGSFMVTSAENSFTISKQFTLQTSELETPFLSFPPANCK